MSNKPVSVEQLLRENFGRFQARDFLVIKKLQKSRRASEREIVEIVTLWDSKSPSDQSLLDFMVAKKILAADAFEVIKKKGLSQVDSLDGFLNLNGFNLFEKRNTKKNKNAKFREIRLHRESEEGPLVVMEAPKKISAEEAEEISEEGIPDVGTRLGKCLLTEIIGKGTSCVVFKGSHQTLDIPVAIKVFLPQQGVQLDVIRGQFVAEAKALAKLNHPYIVRVLDFDPGPPPYIILEFVEGSTLEELIEKYECISHQRAAYYVYRAAVGLVVAHKAGIIHRDIKPANIIITSNDESKLTDLGMAYVATSVSSSGVNLNIKSNAIYGTPAYIAPEQILNPNTGDVRSDIYSLGATFFHAITGRYPFEAKSINDVIMKHLHEPLTPPHEINSEIPVDISLCIQKMMEKKLEDRFQSAEDLLPELMMFFLDSGYYPASSDQEEKKYGGAGPVTSMLINTAKKVALGGKKRNPSSGETANK